MKSKIKRITALLLSAVLCLCLISCTNAATSDITSTSKTTEPLTTVSSTTVSKKEATTNTKEKATTAKKESTTHKQTSKAKSCTVSIECTSLLGNIEKLEPHHEKYVPKDGYILKSYTYTFEKDKTVFDALEYACEKNSIILNSRPSMYGGIYVAGINNLDEFDCGENSGWKYKVNGVDANRGCSYYKLSGGENIVFYYTLKE